ncbi:MAG: hypothetical protein ACTHZD_14745 [Micrococcaceae bacterium]
MATRTRKFLDKQRSIPLNGQPLEPDWLVLLTVGQKAVLNGTAETTPFLDAVMWRGINPRGVQPRPASLNNHLMRQWVDAETDTATEFLREQWGMIRAPETREEAHGMLSTPDCFTAGLGSHRLTAEHYLIHDETDAWAVGHCRDCVRALLWRFPLVSGRPRTWQFYDHEAGQEHIPS